MPMAASRIRQIVHQGAVRAGIQRVYGQGVGGRPLYVVTPHTLRHFHAVRALDQGVPLNDLDLSEGRHKPPTEELRGIRHLKDTRQRVTCLFMCG